MTELTAAQSLTSTTWRTRGRGRRRCQFGVSACAVGLVLTGRTWVERIEQEREPLTIEEDVSP